MPVAFKLSGTSFNQDVIKTLKIKDAVQLETTNVSDDDLSEVEELDGGTSDPPIKCMFHNNLVGYVPKDTKTRVKQLIKDGKAFSIYRLNTYKDNPTIGVRLVAT